MLMLVLSGSHLQIRDISKKKEKFFFSYAYDDAYVTPIHTTLSYAFADAYICLCLYLCLCLYHKFKIQIQASVHVL